MKEGFIAPTTAAVNGYQFPPVDGSDAYLPLRDLAGYAGLGVRTLRRYLTDPAGPLPHYRVGGKVLVRRSDYDGWVLRFRRSAPASLGELVGDVMRDLLP